MSALVTTAAAAMPSGLALGAIDAATGAVALAPFEKGGHGGFASALASSEKQIPLDPAFSKGERATTAKPSTTAHTAPAPAFGQPPSTAGTVGSTVFALLLIVGLILALGWLAKRMPGARTGSAKGVLRVVASVPLGQRERAVVVDVAGTQLLLGVGPGGTRTLHILAAPLPEDAAPPPFAQLLAQHFGKKS
jgi:flagellar protein FliO/FliZ